MKPEIRIFLVRIRKISLPDRIDIGRGLWPHPLLFSNPGETAAYKVKWDLHLRGDLDGERVIE